MQGDLSWCDMILDALREGAEIALIVGMLYLALSWLAQRRRAEWSKLIGQNRMLILLLFTLAITAIKVAEDVLRGESGPVDEAILRYIHAAVPPAMDGFFRAVTFTGSWRFLYPLVLVVSAALFAARNQFESLLLVISLAVCALANYLIKTAVGRARPSLWESDWSWGSSFPSGHTFQTAAVASALVICLARLGPRAVRLVAPLAVTWTLLVGVSRLVLGAHWPSDVITAACLGVIIPFIVQFILQQWRSRSAPMPGNQRER